MEITDLKYDIQHNMLMPFYVFTGDEWKVQDIYIEQMTKLLGRRVYVDCVADIIPKLRCGLFTDVLTLFLVRDDKEFISNEKAHRSLVNALHGNVVVFRTLDIDKRTKFYKEFKDSVVEFKPLEPVVLKRYIKKEINLSDKNIELLMELCEYNYGRCLLEIDKIRCYVSDAEINGYDMDWDEAFGQLVKDGTIYEPPYDAVFDFVDEVLKRHATRAFNLLAQSYAVGESTLVLLSVLYTNTKQVLQVQSCTGDIAKTTGLTSWQIKKAKEKTGNYSISELVNMLKLIQTVEKGIKTGQMEEQYAMQYILANVL